METEGKAFNRVGISVSTSLRAGVPVKVMSERLGHSTPAFTLQQYAHVIPGMQAEAATAISDLVHGAGEPVAPDDASLEDDDQSEQ